MRGDSDARAVPRFVEFPPRGITTYLRGPAGARPCGHAVAVIVEAARRLYAWRRRRVQAATLRAALDDLGDWMLRDIGLDRSEIGSIAEVPGEAERARVRALLGTQFLP